MDLTGFVDVDPDDEQAFVEFLDLNAFAHQTTHNAFLSSGVTLEQYPMFTEDAGENWKEIHYAEHLAWSNELTLGTPPDLVTVDLTDPTQSADWLTLHAEHHLLVNQALGL